MATGLNTAATGLHTAVSSITFCSKKERRKGVHYMDLGTGDLRDLVLQEGIGYDEDRPIEILNDRMQEKCHDVLNGVVWAHIKLLGINQVYDLRKHRIVAGIFQALGWGGRPHKAFRRSHWVAIERYCIFWFEKQFAKICKNLKRMLEGDSKSWSLLRCCGSVVSTVISNLGH